MKKQKQWYEDAKYIDEKMKTKGQNMLRNFETS